MTATRKVALVILALAIGMVAYWLIDGAAMMEKNQVEVVTVEKDPIFNTETRTSTWKDEYHPGLLGYYGAAMGGLFAVAALLYFIGRPRHTDPVPTRAGTVEG